jgi:DNA-directed RNA polymerase subunit RPC12/RpoP
MSGKLEEQIIQKLPYRCPYCDQPISYDQFDLEIGENEIHCPSCKKRYIKVVAPSLTEDDHGPRRR